MNNRSMGSENRLVRLKEERTILSEFCIQERIQLRWPKPPLKFLNEDDMDEYLELCLEDREFSDVCYEEDVIAEDILYLMDEIAQHFKSRVIK